MLLQLIDICSLYYFILFTSLLLLLGGLRQYNFGFLYPAYHLLLLYGYLTFVYISLPSSLHGGSIIVLLLVVLFLALLVKQHGG